MRDKKFYEKYLPKGSNVTFEIGLQGAIIVNGMLAGKVDIGYVGDMPGIVATSHADVRDVRIVSVLGLGYDQCNAFLVRTDAPEFKNSEEAIKWLDGKIVAVPQGSCTDRFARAVFKKYNIKPAEYLNQSIEVITSGFRAKKLDAAVLWEPTTSRLVMENLARKVATGASVNENDGGFMVMPQALIEQRPDVVKAWLNAELRRRALLCRRARLAPLPDGSALKAPRPAICAGNDEHRQRCAMAAPHPATKELRVANATKELRVANATKELRVANAQRVETRDKTRWAKTRHAEPQNDFSR